ncbi:hypothetical protein EJ110_NYTH46928 [Nymphaea thermarum]|nr:hypothetical protein EJ110_NYTH46928 [Nymphaea thermarum]
MADGSRSEGSNEYKMAEKLCNIRQGDQDLSQYFATLTAAYEGLKVFRPPCKLCYASHLEIGMVAKFPSGLSSKYSVANPPGLGGGRTIAGKGSSSSNATSSQATASMVESPTCSIPPSYSLNLSKEEYDLVLAQRSSSISTSTAAIESVFSIGAPTNDPEPSKLEKSVFSRIVRHGSCHRPTSLKFRRRLLFAWVLCPRCPCDVASLCRRRPPFRRRLRRRQSSFSRRRQLFVMAESMGSQKDVVLDAGSASKTENVPIQVTSIRLTKDNYLSWSAALEIGITSRGRLSYITGDNPPLILRKPTSFDMWVVLAKMYGRKKRHLCTYQIKRSIYSLTQGDLSVAAFYAALKTKWEELDYHVTDEWKCG